MSREIVMAPLEPWQKDVYHDIIKARGSRRRFVVCARRQCGKTILAIVVLIAYSLEKKGTSVIIEPTQAQSRRVFKQLVDCLQGSGAITSANATLLTIEFANGSEILFKSAEQGDNLRGFTCTNIMIIDEGAFIPDDIYQIVYPVTDANGCPIMIISTPLFQSGEFYRLFSEGMRGSKLVSSYDWSKYDTSKYLPAEQLEYYRQTLPKTKFQSEYLGQFLSEGSYIFGDISKCINGLSGDAPMYCGIDWGSGNDGDYTVVVMMDANRNVVRLESFKNLDATLQIDRISQMIAESPTLKTIQVELNSIGRVFYDMLRKKSKAFIKGFTTTNDSKRRIIEKLISAFQTNKINIPNDPELIKELQHYSMEKTSKGYTYNGADGVHDDYCMALAICYDLFRDGNIGGTLSFA